MTAEQLHSLLTVARYLPREGLELLVKQLPHEITEAVVRLVNLSGQLLNGPLSDLFQECDGLTGDEACVAFLDHLLRLDRLTRVTLPRGPGGRCQRRGVDHRDNTVCPN